MHFIWYMRLYILPILLFALAACASSADDSTSVSDASSSAVDQTREGFGDAALSPLEDFNLRRQPIPDNLGALEGPYGVADNATCAAIEIEIAGLTESLGPDDDLIAMQDDEDPDRAQWAADKSAETALGAISGQARSFIPFRGLVREATGANSYASRLNRAYRYGEERRAYLKGYGQALGCEWPAAPLDSIPAPDRIIYR